MKYFIDDDYWDLDGYWEQFKTLESRLSRHVYYFFSKHSFHDAFVVSFLVHKIEPDNSLTAEARVIDYFDESIYIIKWKGINKLIFNLDTSNIPNVMHMNVFKQWAYDEITIVDNKFLSHEILLNCGTRIIIQFQDLDYEKITKCQNDES